MKGDRVIIVVGPLHSGSRWCFNTALAGVLSELGEQAYHGSYDRAAGAYPEAVAAREAALSNRERIVEVWTAGRWRPVVLTRRIVVPARWLEAARLTLAEFRQGCAQIGLVN